MLNRTTKIKGGTSSALIIAILLISLTKALAGNTNFRSYVVEGPAVDSIVRLYPLSEAILSKNAIFRVYFSDSVMSVGLTDFEIAPGGAKAVINSVDRQAAGIYDVYIEGIYGSGNIDLDFSNIADITDGAGNPFSDSAPLKEEVFNVLNGLDPPVININTSASIPTANSPIPVTIVFNEPVDGFGISDIVLNNASIQNFRLTDTILYQFQFGTTGNGQGEFANPKGIAVDGLGNIYVADYANERVQKFDGAGNFIFEVGGHTWVGDPEDGKFYLCSGIAVDASGNFYVSDRSGRVQKFDKDGNFLYKFMGADIPGPGDYARAGGLAIDHLGNIYVADIGNQKVKKFDKNGNFLLEFGSLGTGAGQFKEVGGIAIDNANNVYVTDMDKSAFDPPYASNHNRIHKFDPSGNFLETLGGSGESPGEFNYPNFLAIDQQDNIYVTEQYNHRIQKIDELGSYLQHFGRRYGLPGNDKILAPTGIALDRSGNIYVVDEYSSPPFYYAHVRILKENTVATFELVPDSYGEVSFYIPANSAEDGDHNENDSAFFSINYYDDSWPVVNRIKRLSPATAITNDSLVRFEISFNEEVTNVDASDFVIAPGGAIGSISVSALGDDRTYEIEVSGITGEGLLNIDIAEGQDIEDLSALAFAGNIRSEQYFVIDQTIPQASFSAMANDPTNLSPLPLQLHFSERVGGLSKSDISLTNATIDTILRQDTVFSVKNFGTEGIGNGQFSLPEGVEFDSYGNVYVADYSNHRIQKFDTSGNFVLKFGTSGAGNGEFNNPVAVEVDDTGYIYVADYRNHRVQKFDPAGNYLLQFGGYGSADGEIIYPSDIALSSDGNLYVLERGNCRVQKFDANGNFLSRFGSCGAGAAQFDRPEGVCIDTKGDIYVLDTYNNRVQKFSADGTYISQFGSVGDDPGQFMRPKGIETDIYNNLYISGFHTQRIQMWDSAGNYIGAFSPGKGSGEAEFKYPAKISANHKGELIVSDQSNHRLKKLKHEISYTLALIPETADTVRVELPGNSVSDVAGNGNSEAFFTIVYDNTAPQVISVERSLPPDLITNSDTVVFRVGFSEEVQNVDLNDFAIEEGGAAGSVVDIERINDQSFDVKVSAISGSDTLRLRLSDGQDIKDLAGNSSYDTIAGEEYYIIDMVAPKVIITSSASNPTTSNPIAVFITFSEGVTELTEVNLNASNATISDFVKQDSLHYSLNLIPQVSDTLKLEITGNAVFDHVGNASEVTVFTIIYDTLPPVAEIRRKMPVNEYTSTTTAIFSVSFNEAVVNIDTSDFDIAASSVGGAVDSVRKVNIAEYEVVVTNISGNGILNLNFAAGQNITDVLGVPYKGVVDVEEHYIIDNRHPEIVIRSSEPNRTNVSPVPVEIEFDEAVSELYEDSLLVKGAIVSSFLRLSSSHYTLSLLPLASGEITLEVPFDAVRDDAYNENYRTIFRITYDTLAPVANITRMSPEAEYTNAAEVWFSITFNEFVQNVDIADFSLKEGGASGDIAGFTVINNKNYRLRIENISGRGRLGLSFADDAGIEDSLGHVFEGKVGFESQYFIDREKPEINISTSISGPTNISPIPVEIRLGEKTGFLREGDLAITNASVDTFRLIDTLFYHSQFGSEGFGDGQFFFPSAVTAGPEGTIYVADWLGNNVQKFDTSGNFISKFGTPGSGAGEFTQPYDVEIDAFGNIYVVEMGNNRIQKLSPSGEFLMEVGSMGSGEGQFMNPSGIALNREGYFFVVDKDNNRVQKFDPAGKFIMEFGTNGSGAGEFSAPDQIVIDKQGRVLVVDQGNSRIQRFDQNGNYLSQIGSMGMDEGQFFVPSGIAVDAIGNIYVADAAHNSIQKLDSEGNYISQMRSDIDTGDGEFSNPWGLAVMGDRVYVADLNNSRIQILKNQTAYSIKLKPTATDTIRLSIPENTIYDAAGNGNSFTSLAVVFDTATAAPQLISPASGAFVANPVDIAADLPETPLAGSVKLIFYGNSDTITLELADQKIFDFEIDVNDPVASGEVIAAGSSISDDVYSILLQYQDVARNPIAKVINTNVTVDNIPPPTPTIDHISRDSGVDTTDGLTSDNTVAFYGRAEALSSVEVFVKEISIGNTLTDVTGHWVFDHSSVALQNGIYDITAKSTDRAGNQSELSPVFQLQIDTVTPSFDSLISDTELCYHNTSGNLDFIVNDSGPGNLSFSITSSDTTIIPVRDIELIGDHPHYQLIVQHKTLNTGTLTLKIVATDGAGTTEMTFQVNVFSVLNGGKIGINN